MVHLHTLQTGRKRGRWNTTNRMTAQQRAFRQSHLTNQYLQSTAPHLTPGGCSVRAKNNRITPYSHFPISPSVLAPLSSRGHQSQGATSWPSRKVRVNPLQEVELVVVPGTQETDSPKLLPFQAMAQETRLPPVAPSTRDIQPLPSQEMTGGHRLLLVAMVLRTQVLDDPRPLRLLPSQTAGDHGLLLVATAPSIDDPRLLLLTVRLLPSLSTTGDHGLLLVAPNIDDPRLLL